MSTFDDSFFEMHDDSLTPDTVERLFDGENPSPEFADLAAMVDDVRTMASATPTPAVRGALAEYVGVGLTATESSAEPPAPAAVSADLDLTVADQPRRRSVIAEAVTFAGTVSGKLLLGGAVAVASVTGAQASGLVDLPGFPDKPDTVIVADEPTELPFDDDTTADKAEETAEDAAPEAKPEPVAVDEKPQVDDLAEIEEAKAKAEEAAEKEAAEKEAADKEAAEKEAAEKAAAEKEAAEKAEADKSDTPKEEKPSENDEAIAALEAQLRIDKEAVYAAASALIKPLEDEKKPLVQALESTLATLKQARNDAKAPLYAELETTEDAERRAEIEAEIAAILEQWELDRDAAIAEAGPAITAIEVQLENIEIERDAEIARLLEQFHAAVEALQK